MKNVSSVLALSGAFLAATIGTSFAGGPGDWYRDQHNINATSEVAGAEMVFVDGSWDFEAPSGRLDIPAAQHHDTAVAQATNPGRGAVAGTHSVDDEGSRYAGVPQHIE